MQIASSDAPGSRPARDPFDDETTRRVAARSRVGFGVFLGCVSLSALFETLRYPERRLTMALFAGAFVVIVLVMEALIRRRPERSVALLVGAVNLVGVAINAYHVIVRAHVTMDVLVLTSLLGVSSLLFPWGRRGQALACVGTMASYPLLLVAGNDDVLAWAAGGTYLAVLVVLSVAGASLLTGYVRSDLELTSRLSEREERLQVALRQSEAARREAEEANRAKDVFLATVSHELRTPLTSILLWARLLRGGRVTTERAMAAYASIEGAAKAQARLVEDLLDMSRFVSGQARLHEAPVELGLVVRAAADVAAPAAEDKGVALEMSLAPNALWMCGDRDRLQQLVANLLGNAIKFTERGGRVVVSLTSEGGAARITVRDSGQGIGADFLPHVFDPFRQADASPSRRHDGLGLGLAIVRALVERHRGTVRAHSEGKGLGAVFTVELPLFAEDEATTRALPLPAGDARAVASASLAGRRVLVVDDDAATNTAVATLLSSCGAEVRTSDSAASARAVVDAWHPHALVSDLSMPYEDGFSLLRSLRARGDAPGRVPAIALTAATGESDRARSLSAGFQAHVAKPFDPHALVATLESVMQPGLG